MVRVIGLISGTSVDGIDAAFVEIEGSSTNLQVKLIAAQTYPYPPKLRSQILRLCGGESISMAELAQLDDAIAVEFAQAALAIQEGLEPATLIGSHGQTVYHRPPKQHQVKLGYSLQLGRGAVIAQLTNMTTISNFRVADLAVGGQGAPLVSRVDVYLLSHPTYSRCVQNIGGIGNVTYLPRNGLNSSQAIIGWDTGPGNSLLDLAVQFFSNGTKTYDQDGVWASQGTACLSLVEQWLKQDFFQQSPPKSTGRELFGQAYLEQCLIDAQSYNLSPADVLATLTELTTASIEHSYRQFLSEMPDQVLLCGGGSHNLDLKQSLQRRLNPIPVITTSEVGLDADFKEAIAFAVLAYWRLQGEVGNLPEVTGAEAAVLLGEIHTTKGAAVIG
ncbi:anhydro-N-acetylmuramic acid kinase [Limnoraphis robusta]|uniref:Anhydro-N-acetylmuramic acid kinase n=1 Tax=Limnoraphis robusta CCNP1315 TaxID=3110306 RepID=A0ABU5U1N0_9CYAN|nr:anhydro-N-acetylmuramic acid kinase [Limnoraphis robusta]MEA5521105.1 anhydro-N-acetylmuramic acid kinase [Limnoraphis robusta CCNP1315]MEA5547328.1 anhydro-N-acetylmuramic acid kinase [Limnoraphis robusta CCNP1324]